MLFDRYRWRDLLSDPPTGKEYAVILWPVIVDVGHSYVISNPHYAKTNALKKGYRAWMELKCHPDHEAFEKHTDELLNEKGTL